MSLNFRICCMLAFVLMTSNLAAQTDQTETKTETKAVESSAEKFEANVKTNPSMQLKMEVGQTKLVHISQKIIRVSVAEPNVADLQVVTTKQVLVTAKEVGYTHLILWGDDNKPLVLAVSVTRNLDQLKSQFAQLFPKEKIEISSVGDLLVLSGTVSDLRVPARAAEVASLYTDKLANLVKVSGDQQVQLDVKFAEVSRTGMRKSGVNMLWQDSSRGYVAGQSSTGGMPGQYLRGDSSVPGTGAGGPPSVPAPAHGNAFNLFFSTSNSSFPFSAILSILVQEGLAKVLAEPSLTALSGQAAEFHAGGEVPILISEELGRVRMEYKKFGVLLKFTPTVLGKKGMSLKLAIEVSEPDPSSGLVVTGFQVPGFKTRRSETTIRLADGQSFAIAGLLSDSSRHVVNKVPVLGDIPILGMLFRSSAYQREETELLMVVTGHLVQPIKKDNFPLMPGEDEFNDPSDFRLFLTGQIKPKKKTARNQKERELSKSRGVSHRGRAATSVQKHNPPALKAGPLGPIGFMRN